MMVATNRLKKRQVKALRAAEENTEKIDELLAIARRLEGEVAALRERLDEIAPAAAGKENE